MTDYSKVRGFNYQPSYGSTSLENWLYFDPDLVELELRRGKACFPKFNTVRYWLSWDAYFRDPARFRDNFEKSLAIANRLDLKVMPCLFNRWHDVSGYDNGGVYLDNILYPTAWSYYRQEYRDYVEDIVTAHKNDSRIMVWDICNEPFPYSEVTPELERLIPGEYDWLEEIYKQIKRIDAGTPVGVSIHNAHGAEGLERINPISDVLLIHPYFIVDAVTIDDDSLRAEFENGVKMNRDFATKVGKPMLVTETCWGALTDEDRVRIIEFTLDTLTKYDFGFIAHALHYSRVADLHYPEDGFVGFSGNLAFTNKDGTIRKGHEVFNNY